MKTFSLFIAAFATPLAMAAEADYKLYMRTSSGTNTGGGKQILLQNPGSRGNEFRLGNEGTYSEVTLVGHALKAFEKHQPFFDAQITLMFNPPMNSQYGDTTPQGDNVQMIEAYLRGGNFDEMRFSVWAGKRFYRDANSYMNDFFYFADMSGIGAGLEDLQMGNGHLSLAYLQRADGNFQNATNGAPAKQALDIRWRDIIFSEHNILHTWLAAAYSAPGNGTRVDPVTSVGTPTSFEAASGIAAGFRWRHSFIGDASSFNDLSFSYGLGAMSTLTLDSAYSPTNSGGNKAQRFRLVDSMLTKFSERWGTEAIFVFEQSDDGSDSDRVSQWVSLGARPHYFLSEHIRFSLEIGLSDVQVSSERDSSGSEAGHRTLGRVTFAPELVLGKTYFSRPILRTYVTHTFWNGANADITNGGSLLGKLNTDKITALNGERSATQFGFQGEVWF